MNTGGARKRDGTREAAVVTGAGGEGVGFEADTKQNGFLKGGVGLGNGK